MGVEALEEIEGQRGVRGDGEGIDDEINASPAVYHGGVVVEPSILWRGQDLIGSEHPAVTTVELGVHQIIVGHVAVATVAPIFAPRVADDEDFLDIGVAYAAHGVAAVLFASRFIWIRHGHHTAALAALIEVIEQHAAKHDGQTFRQGLLPDSEVDRHLLAALDLEACALLIGGAVGLGEDELLFERPRLFRAGAEIAERFHCQLNHAACVLVLFAIPPAGVVINEEAAHIEILATEATQPVLIGTGDGVGYATAGLPLVFHRAHVRTQIHLLRQLAVLNGVERHVLYRPWRGLHGLVSGLAFQHCIDVVFHVGMLGSSLGCKNWGRRKTGVQGATPRRAN